MKSVLSFLIIGLLSPNLWACWDPSGTCVKSETTAGRGCKSPGVTPKICYIRGDATCYIIKNSTGKDMFIPTNTATEFANFKANKPALLYVTTGTTGSDCNPSCYWSGTCPGVWGSSTNPP